jgi:hypothetical protein
LLPLLSLSVKTTVPPAGHLVEELVDREFCDLVGRQGLGHVVPAAPGGLENGSLSDTGTGTCTCTFLIHAHYNTGGPPRPGCEPVLLRVPCRLDDLAVDLADGTRWRASAGGASTKVHAVRAADCAWVCSTRPAHQATIVGRPGPTPLDCGQRTGTLARNLWQMWRGMRPSYRVAVSGCGTDLARSCSSIISSGSPGVIQDKFTGLTQGWQVDPAV